MSDTIVAVATSMSSSAGVNIVRVSGDKALAIAKKIFVGKKLTEPMQPNYMYLGRVVSRNFTEKAFCVYYKSPFSYTGEDVIEVHCHGGKGVTTAIVRTIRENGARPAEPGEFTKRAFLNNKMSLAEAEGVIDMINARTESQMLNAYRLMSGELMKGIVESEKRLIETASMLEAKLDYPEELEEETRPAAKAALENALKEVDRLLSTTANVKTVEGGADIAIVGVPNAGKSSLLNAIVKQERAIVSDIAGTTRDVLKESVEIDGIRLNFLDTAGIREGKDVIEIMGIERSKKAIESADVILNVIDVSREKNEEEIALETLLKGKKVVTVANKTDKELFPREGVRICAKTGEGVQDVINEIMRLVGRESIYDEGVLTNERHIYALQECKREIEEALSSYEIFPSECILENVRGALCAIGKITGNSVSESIVDEVFSRFCVGK